MPLALLSIGREAAPAPGDGVDLTLSAQDAAGVDRALGRLDGHRLVLDSAGTSGLNLALARVLRAGLLGELETAVLLDEPGPYLRSLGVPPDRAGQLELARTGRSRLVGVIKDDSGGVCVEGAVLTRWDGGGDERGPWWVRAVVDDQRLCDGAIARLTVRRVGPSELVAEARSGRLRRHRCRGRSLQLACDPALIVADGVARDRPRGKRTFWSEPKLWRLTVPS